MLTTRTSVQGHHTAPCLAGGYGGVRMWASTVRGIYQSDESAL